MQCAWPRLQWKHGQGTLILALATFQFFHWFKPSEAFLVPILQSSFGISTDTIYEEIFPWSSYALLPCSILVGVVYEAAGIVPGLLLVGVADVLTTAMVIISKGSLEWLVAS